MTQPAAPTPLDRSLEAFRALLRGEDPNRTFGFGPWEYQVESATSESFDGSPTDPTIPLPPLVGVPYRPSLAGSSCVPTKGTLAYVCFANADPTKPILMAFGPTLPGSVTVNATGPVKLGSAAGAVIRDGDTVAITGMGPASGVITITLGTAETPPAVSRVKA